MARLRWTSQALADLEAVGDFIARDAPSFAQVFVDRVVEAVKRLEVFPLSGRIVPELGRDNLREIIFGSYRIIHLVAENEVIVLTVFHSSRQLKSSDLPNQIGE